jgi:hypothetical protein
VGWPDMRVLVITLMVVAAEYVLIHQFPDPEWVLLTLTVPALLLALTLSGVVGVVSGLTGRKGGARR